MAEFVVIVVGVLVALAVDDWRQGQVDRRLERHLLETMLVDSDETVFDLQEAIRSAEARMSAVAHVLNAAGAPLPLGELPPPPVFSEAPLPTDRQSEVGNWLILVGYTQVFDPRTAGYDEMMASGSLSVLRDPELRSAIVRYYLELTDLQESNRVFREDGLALRNALESAGLAVGDVLSDDEVLRRLRNSDRALASLRRTYLRAQEQPHIYPRVIEMVEEFRRSIEQALADL
ncbi:MAG: hypothetical protein ACYTFO_07730 [Planctomycetota bacterium]|jgi:hypothetical protein